MQIGENALHLKVWEILGKKWVTTSNFMQSILCFNNHSGTVCLFSKCGVAEGELLQIKSFRAGASLIVNMHQIKTNAPNSPGFYGNGWQSGMKRDICPIPRRPMEQLESNYIQRHTRMYALQLNETKHHGLIP